MDVFLGVIFAFNHKDGQVDVIRVLLQAGADVNRRSEGGETAMDFAEEGDAAYTLSFL